MVTVPDQISTLELSKIWLYKALQEIEAENSQDQEKLEDQQEQEETES